MACITLSSEAFVGCILSLCAGTRRLTLQSVWFTLKTKREGKRIVP